MLRNLKWIKWILSLVFRQDPQINRFRFYVKRLIGVFGVGDHDYVHEKSLHWTIEGLRVDFRRTAMLKFLEKRLVDLQLFIVKIFFCVQIRDHRGQNPR